MNHSFDIDIAVHVGVHAAIIFQNIGFWVTQNLNHERNIANGKAWFYSTPEALAKDYPYLTINQIRYSLTKLKEAGMIETGCFNTDKKNRTTWYTLTDKGKALYRPTEVLLNAFEKIPKCDLKNFQNAFGKIPKSSITDINITDINTDVTDFPKMENHTRTTDPKHKYGEYKHVLLTDKEYERLINDYGEDDTRAAIKFLDEYIEEKHYKSNSHNLALRRWVFDAVKERKEKAKPKTAPGQYDWDNL